MHLFLTSVLPFLAHNHASAVAFLTCRHHNFHASIIPEFLSDEERVKSFYWARQQNQLQADKQNQYKTLCNLFVQTPLMQFSPSLVLRRWDCVKTVLKPLLATKYFSRTLQRCDVESALSSDLLRGLSKVQSLTKLDLGESVVENDHIEIIINTFLSVETIAIGEATCLDRISVINISSPPPPATKTLRSLTLRHVYSLFATKFVPHFTNLRKLHLRAKNEFQKLDLRPLSSSLPLLTDLSLNCFRVDNIESLKSLVHLLKLRFRECHMPDLSFLTRLSHLTTFCMKFCARLSPSSFAPLAHVPNLRVLEVFDSEFNNDSLQYLDNMVHLRKLDLSHSRIVGDSRLLKTLMQNLFQLEELNLGSCFVGNKGAIAEALYSPHSRLRVLNLKGCSLEDDDLKGIGALKNTLEELDLSVNKKLSNEALLHCRDLLKLKNLDLRDCIGIDDLSPLKDCWNLEVIKVSFCDGLSDDSFKVFSEYPKSFPNLRVLSLSYCKKLTAKVFEHLSKNSHLVYQLKELYVMEMSEILTSSETARKNLGQLKGIRRLCGVVSDICGDASNKEIEVMKELVRSSTNLDEIK